MDLSVTTETYGGDKKSWLGSRHGVTNARTVTIDHTKLTGTDHPGGALPSGFPLSISGNLAVPYTGAEEQVLAGFLLTSQSVRAGGGNIIGPMLDHGRVIVAKLPISFTAPDNPGAFIFV